MNSVAKVKGASAEHRVLEGVDVRALLEQAKLDEVSVLLCKLLEHANVSRAELARRLNWKPSRVTKVLSGEDNLTLRTLIRLLDELGYDFDVLLRKAGSPRARQLWDRPQLSIVYTPEVWRDRLKEKERLPALASNYKYKSVLEQEDVCANDAKVNGRETVAA